MLPQHPTRAASLLWPRCCTVAAKGLGEVIIAGLQSNNVAFVLQGGLVVALLAVLIHDGLGLAERLVARKLGRPQNEVS